MDTKAGRVLSVTFIGLLLVLLIYGVYHLSSLSSTVDQADTSSTTDLVIEFVDVSQECREAIRANPPGWMFEEGGAVHNMDIGGIERGFIAGKGSDAIYNYTCMKDEERTVLYSRTDKKHGVEWEQ